MKNGMILAILLGMLANEARAYEAGVGIGRQYGCLTPGSGDDAVCSVGPAVTVQWGLNLWGKAYRTEDHDGSSPAPSEGTGGEDSGDGTALALQGREQ